MIASWEHPLLVGGVLGQEFPLNLEIKDDQALHRIISKKLLIVFFASFVWSQLNKKVTSCLEQLVCQQ